jgi:RNA polymerase sigma-70 factor (ECF subfamily)
MKLTVQDPFEDAFRHVLANRTVLLMCVKAIVRDPHLVEDTLSDVTMEIVRNWEKYDPSRPFAPWARGVARRVALTNLRKAGRMIATLDDEVIDLLGAEMEAQGGESRFEQYKDRLNECLSKLSASARRLVIARYFNEVTYDELAAQERRTNGALYVAFVRIHQTLARCVKRQRTTA